MGDAAVITWLWWWVRSRYRRASRGL